MGTSILASFLAIRNAASRYLYALAADDLLPGQLAAIHADHHAPHVALVTMTVFERRWCWGLGALGGLALCRHRVGVDRLGHPSGGPPALRVLAPFGK